MTELTFTEAKLEGGWLMVKPSRSELGKAMAFIRKMKATPYDLSLKEHREKRSLDANAYAWVLIHKLAAAMGIPPVEVYRNAIPRFQHLRHQTNGAADRQPDTGLQGAGH